MLNLWCVVRQTEININSVKLVLKFLKDYKLINYRKMNLLFMPHQKERFSF
jgi:hypothetical protein